jgi:hypothetical protein
MAAPGDFTAPKARNGQLQACEPCRKGKMACDHRIPVCDRCVRRGITDRCLYGGPSLSGHPQTSNSLHPLPTLHAEFETLLYGHDAPSSLANKQDAGLVLGRSSCKSRSAESILQKQQLGSPTPGSLFSNPSRSFYGPTSFSSVFMENESYLGPDLIQVPDESGNTANTEASSSTEMEFLIETGIRAMRYFPTKEHCDKLLDMSDSIFSLGFNVWMVRRTIGLIWSLYGSHLKEPRNDRDLTVVVKVLLLNGKTPLVHKSTENGVEWMNGFTGPNLRWEVRTFTFCRVKRHHF